MWSASQICRCAHTLKSVKSTMLTASSRNGYRSGNLMTRQLYTPVRSSKTNKLAFRISDIIKSNNIAVRLCASAQKPSTQTPKIVGYWLLGCSGMVFTAVVLGMVAGYLILLYSVYFVVKIALTTTNGSK